MWLRGTYFTALRFDTAVVGIIDYNSASACLMTYVDADPANTTFSDGSALIVTGSDSNPGADDNQWHQRTGYGNGGSVFTSSEIGNGENAPALKTEVTIQQAGTYDIWINFWANPLDDWRIKAGLHENNMQISRSMASKQVDAGAHNTTLDLSGTGNTYLYQAYLGRTYIGSNGGMEIYLDDESIQTGSSNTGVGNIARTWYEWYKLYKYRE